MAMVIAVVAGAILLAMTCSGIVAAAGRKLGVVDWDDERGPR